MVVGLPNVYIAACLPLPLGASGTRREEERMSAVGSTRQQWYHRDSLRISAMLIGPKDISRDLGLGQLHFPTLRLFQEFKTINTILVKSRPQYRALVKSCGASNLQTI